MERFIKWFVGLFPESIQKIYYKYEEKWLYLVFGGLTTIVAIASKLLVFTLIAGEPFWENTTGVVISWICAVTFAFFTNKKYVFKSETNTKEEFRKVFISFYGSRIATLIMEWLIFVIFCDLLHFSQLVITLVSQVLILVANYILSKVFVFKKKDNVQED